MPLVSPYVSRPLCSTAALSLVLKLRVRHKHQTQRRFLHRDHQIWIIWSADVCNSAMTVSCFILQQRHLMKMKRQIKQVLMHNNMQIGSFSGLMWLFQTAVLKSSPLTRQVSSAETCWYVGCYVCRIVDRNVKIQKTPRLVRCKLICAEWWWRGVKLVILWMGSGAAQISILCEPGLVV